MPPVSDSKNRYDQRESIFEHKQSSFNALIGKCNDIIESYNLFASYIFTVITSPAFMHLQAWFCCIYIKKTIL